MTEAKPWKHSDEAHVAFARRIPLRLIMVPLAVLTAASFAGDALWPTLAPDHPLWLISLNSRSRYLVLVSPLVDWAPFVAVAVARALIGDPFAYLLGARYGERAIAAISRRAGRLGNIAERVASGAGRAGPAAVLLAPGPVVCMLVGAGGMNFGLFLALNLIGTVVRISIIRAGGATFADPLTSLVEVVARNRVPLTALAIVTVVVTILIHRGRRRYSTDLNEVVGELEPEAED